MKTFQSLAVAAGLFIGAQAQAVIGLNGTYATVTLTVEVYELYCPYATTIFTNGATYTAGDRETLTITDCPCTYVSSYPVNTVAHSYLWPTAPVYTWLAPVCDTTTKIVDTYTTYCPGPTTVVQNSKTYTVTGATTLTITDCPCTAVETVPVTSGYITSTFSVLTTYVPAATTLTVGDQTYPVASGTVTVPIVSVAAITAATPVGPTGTTTGVVQVTNAAIKNVVNAGAFAAAGLAILL